MVDLIGNKSYQSIIEGILQKNNFIVHNIGETLIIDNDAPIPPGHCYHGRLSGEYSFRVIYKSG
jgi:hypothetical protein